MDERRVYFDPIVQYHKSILWAGWDLLKDFGSFCTPWYSSRHCRCCCYRVDTGAMARISHPTPPTRPTDRALPARHDLPQVLLMRMAKKDFTVTSKGRSFTVPKGHYVGTSPYVAMRLPDVFEAPDKVRRDSQLLDLVVAAYACVASSCDAVCARISQCWECGVV